MAVGPESEQRHIRIPRTCSRRDVSCWAKLLSSVDSGAHDGFGFHGIFLRCGREIPESALWPDATYPRMPVLIECAGPVSTGCRNETLWVVWRYDQGRFLDIARSVSAGPEWAIELVPIARRAIERQAGPRVVKKPAQIATELARTLDRELEPLSDPEKAATLDCIYHQLAVRLAEADEVPRKPAAREAAKTAAASAG